MFSKLAVGGKIPSSRAFIVKTDSKFPAAPTENCYL